MAGILVSGGTYSGSGDVTTDWVKIMNVADGWFIAPDGNLTLVANTGGYSMQTALPTGASAGFHSNGGTVVFAADGTNPMINVDGFNGMGHFYNIQTTLATTRYHTRIKASGNLTIDAGTTFESSRAAYTSNNTYVDFAKDLYVAGTFGNTVGDKLDTGGVGDAFGSVLVVGGGTLNACSGNTTINYDSYNLSLYSVAYRNAGTMVHNTGTLVVKANGGSNTFGGGGGTGNPYNVHVENLGGGAATPYIRAYNTPNIDNDFTVSGSLDWAHLWGDGHVVSGNVIIRDGATYTETPISGTLTIGSLIVEATSTFTAGLSGTTTITGPANGDYLWRSNAGTFNHNEGLVYINTGSYNATDIYPASTQYFYDLTLSGTGTVEMYGCTIANDFDVGADVIFRPISPTQAFVVSGTATMNGFFGKDGYPQTVDNTFGAIDIPAGGTYYATTGTTLLHGTASPLDNDGTFTHNSGTVVYSGSAYTMATGDAATTFYDVVSKTTAATDGLRLNTPTAIGATILNSVKCEVGYMARFDSGNGNALTTLGDSTHQCTVYNSGTRWRISPSTNYTVDIYGGDEVLPFIWKGTAPEWNITTARTDRPTSFKWCDFKTNSVNLTTPGVADYVIALDGDCAFNAFTLTALDAFDTNEYRVEFGGELNTTGDLVTSGSLMVLGDKITYLGGSWLGNETTDIIIAGTGATQDFAGQPYQTIMFNGTGEDRLNWANSFEDTTSVIVGSTFRPDFNLTAGNTIIANGGTWNNESDTLTASKFSNRGGLFASSSAVTIDSATNSYAQTGDGVNPLTASVTWECWFNSTGTAGEMLMANDDSPSRRGGYLKTNGTVITWYLNGVTNTVTTNSNIVATGSNHEDGKWHNITAVYDSGNYLYLYLDGKLIGKDAATGTPSSDSGVRFYLGYANSNYFNGTFGRVSVWSSALTGAQIRKMMFEDFATATTTNCVSWYQFDEGQGTTLATKVGGGTLYMGGGAAWATGGTWTAGGTLSSSAGSLYIGNRGTDVTVFANSYFNIGNRRLISGSKFASKAHLGTLEYYIATSGTNDYLLYAKLSGAPIGIHNDVKIVPPADGTTEGSYFTFDSNADNEQCNTLVNYGGSYVRILTNEDFYTQDFDNQGTWVKNPTYDGIIHDDGSTPNEYNPIDIMDDQDSGFDAEDLID